MEILTILLFLIICWGFGFSITSLLKIKESKNNYETNTMRIGIGSSLFSVISVLFATLRIPLNWWLFLILALIVPLINYKQIFNNEKLKFKLNKNFIFFSLALILVSFNLFMYLNGAFEYKYFEDGDPWNHGGGVKYIALEKTVFEPFESFDVFHYLDPYPPAFGIIMGMMYQFSGNIIWTLKFFNSFFISIGILFFYYFASSFMKNKKKALLATFILSMIPCYMSHFIWAHTLVIMLLFPLLYSLTKLNKDKKWWPIIGITFAAVWMVQPTQAFKISIVFAIYYFIKLILDRKNIKELTFAGISAIIISLVSWWGYVWLKTGSIIKTFSGANKGLAIGEVGKNAWWQIFKHPGSADRIYTFKDFFIAKSQNMINNPIGVGIILMSLLVIVLVFITFKYKDLFKKENNWKLISLAWLLFTFLGIHGARTWMPFQMFAFRFWMLFAIFFSIIVADGLIDILNILKKYKAPITLILIILIIGIWFTSGIQKYTLNTSKWGPSAEFVDAGQFESWEYIRTMPKDTKIFYPCSKSWILNLALLSYDKYTCAWCEDEYKFRESIINKTGTEVIGFAKSKNYNYLYVDARCRYDFNENLTLLNNFLINVSSQARLEHKSKGGFLWRI